MSVFCFIDRWSSVTIAGQAPPPCSSFTLTKVGEKRAAMFGGWSGSETSNDLLFVELGRYCVVSMPITYSELCMWLILHSHSMLAD